MAPDRSGASPADAAKNSGPVNLPTRYGDFQAYAFEFPGGEEHLALVRGDPSGEDVLARVHSSCVTGDALGSERCDCGPQLQDALRRIAEEGRGVVLYLQQEGRGIGLANKIRAYALQDLGADTVEANVRLGFAPDLRDYEPALQMLRTLGTRSVRLLTNNPEKVAALEKGGITVRERIPLVVGRGTHNARYLDTKRDVMGHLLIDV